MALQGAEQQSATVRTSGWECAQCLGLARCSCDIQVQVTSVHADCLLRHACSVLVDAQVQMRDIPGFVESRAAILAMKPGHKGHWISFAIAHHLNGDYSLAAQALKTYQGIQVRVSCLLSQLQPSSLWLVPLHVCW